MLVSLTQLSLVAHLVEVVRVDLLVDQLRQLAQRHDLDASVPLVALCLVTLIAFLLLCLTHVR